MRQRDVRYVHRGFAGRGESGADRYFADAEREGFLRIRYVPPNVTPIPVAGDPSGAACARSVPKIVSNCPGATRRNCAPSAGSTRHDTRLLAAKSADILVTTDGLVYVTDWNAGLNVLQYEG